MSRLKGFGRNRAQELAVTMNPETHSTRSHVIGSDPMIALNDSTYCTSATALAIALQ